MELPFRARALFRELTWSLDTCSSDAFGLDLSRDIESINIFQGNNETTVEVRLLDPLELDYGKTSVTLSFLFRRRRSSIKRESNSL